MSDIIENGWDKYQRLVLSELKRLDESHKGLIRKVDDLRTDVAILKVKYALLGGLIGAIPGIVAIVLQIFK